MTYEPGEGPITEDDAKTETPAPSPVPDQPLEDPVDVPDESTEEPATPELDESSDVKQDQQTG